MTHKNNRNFIWLFILGALFFSFSISEVSALKAEGKSGWKYGSETAHIVCGDRLCSEIEEKPQDKILKSSEIVEELSPLKQVKLGIDAKEITCNVGLVLVLKTTNGQPACISQNSMEKLLERGWAASLD